jgi:anti-sigma factor RsiW
VSLLLAEGLLRDDDERALARHVEHCARCARERAELERLARVLQRDATPAPSDIAEARMKLRRALARERGAMAGGTSRTTLRRDRLRWRTFGEAAGFALLLALLVPVLPRLHGGLAPAAANGVVATLAHEARELVASAGSWLPALPEWRLPAAPPESLRTWFGALHSDAR